MYLKGFLTLLLIICWTGGIYGTPENIKPGVIYYSDEIDEDSEIMDLIDEKNYEEVYRNYTYYEAVYNDHKKLQNLKEFKRGELLWMEIYHYDAQGTYLRKERK